MGKGFGGFLNLVKLSDYEDEEYDDDYDEEDEDDYYEPVKEKKSKKKVDVEPARDKSGKASQKSGSNVFQFKNSKQILEVTILKAVDYERDAPQIADLLKEGRAVIINLAGADPEIARRIFDYAAGCVYITNGNLQNIAQNIFICTPSNVDISGDIDDAISSIAPINQGTSNYNMF